MTKLSVALFWLVFLEFRRTIFCQKIIACTQNKSKTISLENVSQINDLESGIEWTVEFERDSLYYVDVILRANKKINLTLSSGKKSGKKAILSLANKSCIVCYSESSLKILNLTIRASDEQKDQFALYSISGALLELEEVEFLGTPLYPKLLYASNTTKVHAKTLIFRFSNYNYLYFFFFENIEEVYLDGLVLKNIEASAQGSFLIVGSYCAQTIANNIDIANSSNIALSIFLPGLGSTFLTKNSRIINSTIISTFLFESRKQVIRFLKVLNLSIESSLLMKGCLALMGAESMIISESVFKGNTIGNSNVEYNFLIFMNEGADIGKFFLMTDCKFYKNLLKNTFLSISTYFAGFLSTIFSDNSFVSLSLRPFLILQRNKRIFVANLSTLRNLFSDSVFVKVEDTSSDKLFVMSNSSFDENLMFSVNDTLSLSEYFNGLVSFDTEGSVFLDSIYFFGNFDYSGIAISPCISSYSHSKLFFNNIKFLENVGNGLSSTISVLLADVLLLLDSVFEKNEQLSIWYGVSLQGRLLFLDYLKLINNGAGIGSAINFFENNYFWDVAIFFQNSYVESNFCNSGTVLFYRIAIATMVLKRNFFKNNKVSRGGALYFTSPSELDKQFILIYECTFYMNKASAGAVGYFTILSNVFFFIDCLFFKNSARKNGGVFSMNSANTCLFFIKDCNFASNSAVMSAGAFEIRISVVQVHNSVFFSNTADTVSNILVSSFSIISLERSILLSGISRVGYNLKINLYAKAVLLNIIIYNCSAPNNAGLSLTLSIRLYAKSIFFVDNKCFKNCLFYTSFLQNTIMFLNIYILNMSSFNTSFVIFSARFHMENVFLINLKGQIFALENATVAIKNFIVSNFYSESKMLGSLFRMRTFSFLSFQDMLIWDVSSKGAVNGFFDQENSVVEIKGAFFFDKTRNKDNVFYYSLKKNSSLSLEAIVLKVLSKIFIESQNSVLLIKSSKFYSDVGFDQSLLTGLDSFINLQNSLFQSYRNTSAIQLEHKPQKEILFRLLIAGCKFINNSNSHAGGGALFLRNYHLFIESTEFIANEAIEGVGGGAVLLMCMHDETSLCEWHIIDSFFKENSAGTKKGGAIYWSGSVPFFKNNTYSNNRASYGDDISSEPFFLHLKSSQVVTNLLNFISGCDVEPNLEFSHKDYYNQTIKIEKSKHCELSITSSLNKSASIMGRGIVLSDSEGICKFEDLKLIIPPGSTAILRVFSASIEIKSSSALESAGFASDVAKRHSFAGENKQYVYLLDVNSLFCPEGYIYNSVFETCDYCQRDFYAFKQFQSCARCPDNAYCPGGNKIIPNNGYWKSDEEFSKTIYKCKMKAFCKGQAGRYCSPGFQGILCSKCTVKLENSNSSSSFIDFDNSCKACESSILILPSVIFALILLVAVGYIAFLIKQKMNSKHNLTTVLLKIFTHYLQIMGIIFSLSEIKMPWSLDDLVNINININKPESFMLPFDCYLSGAFGDINIYFKKTLVLSIAICFIPACVCSFWVILYKFKKKFTYLKPKIFVSLLIIFFTYQPSFVNEFFNGLICKEIEGNEYLMASPTQLCWTREHLIVISLVNIPMILLLSLVIPLFFIFFINRRRGFTETTNEIDFSFLTSSYKSSFYYWDMVLMSQKIIFIIFIAGLKDNTVVITKFFLFFSFLFLVFQQVFQPYKSKICNKVALLSSLAIHSSILFSMIQISWEKEQFFSIFTSLFLIGNIGFLFFYGLVYYSMNKRLMMTLNRCFSFLGVSFKYIDSQTGAVTEIRSTNVRATFIAKKKSKSNS